MKFTPTELNGVWIVDIDPIADDRGFFARSWCRDEFAAHGLNPALVQCNISYNRRRGTLRGMHYQAAPHEEAKLVRVTRGAVFDVVLDIRPNSPTLLRWVAVELDDESRRALYVPEGLAHGFQTLRDDTEVLYQMGAAYHPASARGIRWNDPALDIPWPVERKVLSDRDAGYADLDVAALRAPVC